MFERDNSIYQHNYLPKACLHIAKVHEVFQLLPTYAGWWELIVCRWASSPSKFRKPDKTCCQLVCHIKIRHITGATDVMREVSDAINRDAQISSTFGTIPLVSKSVYCTNNTLHLIWNAHQTHTHTCTWTVWINTRIKCGIYLMAWRLVGCWSLHFVFGEMIPSQTPSS